MNQKAVQNNVAVLMSTYNGEKYLREQLDSIYAQNGVKFDVYVRDDGSIDSTCEILQEYKEKYGLIWYSGKNIGYGYSFMELLYNAPDTEYYAFADQDDVWHTDKLLRAVTELSREDQKMPLLYCANQNMVDENLNFKRLRLKQKDVKDLSLSKTILGNVFAGCTMLLNKTLRDIVSRTEYRPPIIDYHDEWVLVVAEIFGKVVFDPFPVIEYRRHSNTTTNIMLSSHFSNFKKIQNKLFNFFNPSIREKNWGNRARIAKELLTMFDKEITGNTREEIQLLARYKIITLDRIRLLFNMSLLKKTYDPLPIAWFKVIIGYY